MDNSNLTQVIEDAVADATVNAPEGESIDPSPTSVASDSAEPALEASQDGSGDVLADDTTEDASAEVKSPAGAQNASDDPFEKEHGIQAKMSGDRENRIPYSRVKAIVGKAEQKVRKEFEPITAQVKDLQAKWSQAEPRLRQVDQFEKIMVNEKMKFLQMLTTIPGYKEIFDGMAGAAAGAGKPAQTAPVGDDMPQPDQELSDGSRVYSLDGLKTLMEWQAKKTEDRVTQQISKKYQPIEEAWQLRQQEIELMPVIKQQIDEARTWHLFTENEDDITKALAENAQLSLEGAYRQVVFPKLITDQTTMRQKLLKEINAAPRGSTSAAARSVRPGTIPAGPRSLEDVIAEAAGVKFDRNAL